MRLVVVGGCGAAAGWVVGGVCGVCVMVVRRREWVVIDVCDRSDM
jgi:hypothetical protein